MPTRTCVVTKQRAEQSALLRMTVQNGKLAFDSAKKLPGRGAYVLPSAIKSLPKLTKKLQHVLREKQVKGVLEAVNEIEKEAL